jgi:predicted PurR-regulated permease PerM
MESELAQVLQSIKDSETRLENQIDNKIDNLKTQIDSKIDTFNERFDNYQKATQSLVNLAFSLIASATVITVVSSVFRR